MARYLLPALLALTLLALAPGCDSSETGGTNDPDCLEGTMTATADGSAYAAACVFANVESNTVTITGLTNIDGSAGSAQRQINLTALGAAAGTYSAPGGAVMTYAAGDSPTALSLTTATSGQLVLQEVGASRVRGTFQFSGPEFDAAGAPTGRTVTVSSGSFDIER
jgi:hypothetical protein